MRYFNRTFKNPEQVQQLIEEYKAQEKKNLSLLGRMHKVDRSAVYYWLGLRDSHGKRTGVTIPQDLPEVKYRSKYEYLLEEKVNEGHNYKDYIKKNTQPHA